MSLLAATIVLFLVAISPPARAKPSPTTAPPAPPPEPSAYVLVDADTGNVLAAKGDRQRMYPASTIKLVTALMAAERLPTTDLVPVSALAESMPARKMNVKAGQQWTLIDLLHAMLMVSANDAAVAIAERVGGGSLDQWSALAQQMLANLGAADSPVLRDPAGLDDSQFGRDGGSQISARDLAMVGRAVLARPDLMAIIQTKHYEFKGGDGNGHELTNQDPFFTLYEGATGLKTGTTDKAGRTFVGSASRNGRSMLVVILDAIDPLRSAEQYLDQGFATPAATESTVDALPAVVQNAATMSPPTTASNAEVRAGNLAAAAIKSATRPDLSIDSPPVAVAILLCGLVLLAVVRRVMNEFYARQRIVRRASDGIPDEW